TSDAPYHDVDHTVMVTLLGTDLLRGREIAEVVAPDDWLHTTVALLCHDVGYVRGACRGDTATEVVVDLEGTRLALPRGASDAWLIRFPADVFGGGSCGVTQPVGWASACGRRTSGGGGGALERGGAGG